MHSAPKQVAWLNLPVQTGAGLQIREYSLQTRGNGLRKRAHGLWICGYGLKNQRYGLQKLSARIGNL